MKKILGVTLLLLSSLSEANSMHCGDINKLRVWVHGNDTYGVWVEYESNPGTCPGGFFLPHESDNKNLAYSLLLSSKASNQRVCIQTAGTSMIGSRCRVNYVMHE